MLILRDIIPPWPAVSARAEPGVVAHPGTPVVCACSLHVLPPGGASSRCYGKRDSCPNRRYEVLRAPFVTNSPTVKNKCTEQWRGVKRHNIIMNITHTNTYSYEHMYNHKNKYNHVFFRENSHKTSHNSHTSPMWQSQQTLTQTTKYSHSSYIFETN